MSRSVGSCPVATNTPRRTRARRDRGTERVVGRRLGVALQPPQWERDGPALDGEPGLPGAILDELSRPIQEPPQRRGLRVPLPREQEGRLAREGAVVVGPPDHAGVLLNRTAVVGAAEVEAEAEVRDGATFPQCTAPVGRMVGASRRTAYAALVGLFVFGSPSRRKPPARRFTATVLQRG